MDATIENAQKNTVSPPVRIFLPLYPHPYLFWDGVEGEEFLPNIYYEALYEFQSRAKNFLSKAT